MLTRRMQLQAIVDLAAGLKASERTERRWPEFGEPWRSLYERLSKMPPEQRGEGLLSVIENLPDRDKVLAEVMYLKPGGGLGAFKSLADEASSFRPVEWLWKKWIPLAMLTLMGAQPGTGKSFAALDLCKRTIQGERWPDGQEALFAGQPAIYVDAENVPQLLHARATTMGLDQRKLYLMRPAQDEIVLDFSLEKNQELLANMAAQIQPKLIIVDSISTIMPRGENNIEDVRVTLSYFTALAREFDTAVVLIHHLRKHSSGQMDFLELSLDDFRGSGHIVAMARSVIGMSTVQTTADSNKGAPRKFEVMKTNISEYAKPLGFVIKAINADEAMLVWQDAAPKVFKEPTQRDDCREWMEDYLKETMEGKPTPPKDVVKAAADEGFSRALVFQVRKDLRAHIKNTEGRKTTGNCWQWSETIVQYDDDAGGDDDDITEDGD